MIVFYLFMAVLLHILIELWVSGSQLIRPDKCSSSSSSSCFFKFCGECFPMFRDVNLDLLQLFEFGVVGVKVDWKVIRCWRVGLETGEQSSFYTIRRVNSVSDYQILPSLQIWSFQPRCQTGLDAFFCTGNVKTNFSCLKKKSSAQKKCSPSTLQTDPIQSWHKDLFKCI